MRWTADKAIKSQQYRGEEMKEAHLLLSMMSVLLFHSLLAVKKLSPEHLLVHKPFFVAWSFFSVSHLLGC